MRRLVCPQVSAVPTVIAMRGGDVVDQFVGIKDDDELDSFVSKVIGQWNPPVLTQPYPHHRHSHAVLSDSGTAGEPWAAILSLFSNHY